MKNINQHIIDLRLILGPTYSVTKYDHNTIDINTPFTNLIGDNYRVLVYQDDIDNELTVSDDGDAINEFNMMDTSKTNAIEYVKRNHVDVISGEIISQTCTEDELIATIYRNLSVQMGLTALQYFSD